MRIFTIALLTLAALGGGWYLWQRYPALQEIAQSKVGASSIASFKIRYSAEALMKSHREALLKEDSEFLEPILSYYPYLLMEIKFAKSDSSTQEGVLLWGMSDGEMVIQTSSWEKTHGFQDCLASRRVEMNSGSSGRSSRQVGRSIARGSTANSKLKPNLSTAGWRAVERSI